MTLQGNATHSCQHYMPPRGVRPSSSLSAPVPSQLMRSPMSQPALRHPPSGGH
ncbi:hypothetical protein BD779DRAFT_1507989 [Infundibulicybe gibba]|nr:hypothetical protein BD779DRAFT_1507989 [Infundibulicybe gibba]